MKYVAALSLLFVLTIAVAQNQAPAGSSFQDTIQFQKDQMDKQEALLALQERRLNLEERSNELNMRQAMLNRNFTQQMGHMKDNSWLWHGGIPQLHPRFLLALIFIKVVALCMLFYLAVNILLTILIGIDMRNRSSFNGLWIPLLLIAGLPVSIIYALFRIGDRITEKRT